MTRVDLSHIVSQKYTSIVFYKYFVVTESIDQVYILEIITKSKTRLIICVWCEYTIFYIHLNQ